MVPDDEDDTIDSENDVDVENVEGNVEEIAEGNVEEEVESAEENVFVSAAKKIVKNATTRKPKSNPRTKTKKTPSSDSPIVITYLLNVPVMFEKDVVHQMSSTRKVNSESEFEKRFFFRPHLNEMSLKAQRHADDKTFACRLVNVKATVAWNGIKPQERMSLMLEESWLPIEEVLIFRYENGAKSLAVDLIYQFARTKSGEIPEDPTAAVSKKLGTATLKLQKELEERAILHGQTVERMTALQSLHVCNKKTCENFGRYCWNDEERDQHYIISSHQFVAWNKALDDDVSGVTSQMPPSTIRESMYSQKGKRKTASSTPKQESQEDSTRHLHPIYQHPAYQSFPPWAFAPPSTFVNPLAFANPSAFIPSSPLPQLHSSQFPSYSPSQASDFGRHRDETPVDRRDRQGSYAPSVVAPPAAPSSPVEEDLEDYVNWHIQSKPHLKGVLRHAYDRLMEGGYDLMTIQTLKGIEHQSFWSKLSIPPGIGIQLARDVSKFGRQMQMQMPPPSSRRMPPPPSRQMSRRPRYLPTSQMTTQANTQVIKEVDEEEVDETLGEIKRVDPRMEDAIEEDELENTYNLEYDYAEEEY